MPTIPAANPPIASCPSAPTLNSPARPAIANARPVQVSVVALYSTWPKPYGLPHVPSTRRRNTVAGASPNERMSKSPTTAAIAKATSGARNADASLYARFSDGLFTRRLRSCTDQALLHRTRRPAAPSRISRRTSQRCGRRVRALREDPRSRVECLCPHRARRGFGRE